MSATPNFATIIRTAATAISAANAARDGTGTIVDVLPAGAAGTRIDDLDITAKGTTTAGMVRLFLKNGANYALWREYQVPANTVSATNPAWTISLSNLGLILASGWSLAATTEKAEAFNVIVKRAGDY
jgi:hypothetical protein